MNVIDYQLSDEFELWADKEFRVLRGSAVRLLAELKAGTVKGVAREIGISRTQSYQERVPVSGDLRDRLVDLTRVLSNALELFDHDREKVSAWLFRPNRQFLNLSPYEMTLAGKGRTVYEHQEGNLGYERA